MNEIEVSLRLSELFVRLFLAILLVAQGYDKLFVIKISQVIDTFLVDARQKRIPYFFIAFSAYFTSIVEFSCGILLLLGLFHDVAIIVLIIDFLVVCIGFSILNPMWDLKNVFPRLLLLIITIMLSPFFYFGLDMIFFP